VAIEIKLNPEVGALGPATLLVATSSVADPQPGPWSWIWDFIETVDNRTMVSVTTTTTAVGPSQYRYLYNQDLQTPSQLATSFTIKDGTSVRVNVRLLNDNGQQIDTGTNLFPWQTSIQQHFDMMRIVASGQATGGFTQADRDKLDQVLAAVYRTWPSA
jgi:hypothetical protein